ncbi:MAG: four helix bundle protein [Proteobacteria bacterium]|nr:four helix bundle protein [Pseudomonadota bacterium]
MTINSYQDLIVWQKAFRLAIQVYKVTQNMPKEEIYGLTSQMRRSAVSIPSNIAEGYSRHSSAAYKQFLSYSLGSKSELETQLLICKEIGYLNKEDIVTLLDLLNEIGKMINSLIQKV